MATGSVHAIRGVDFHLKENELLALVGASGGVHHDPADGRLPSGGGRREEVDGVGSGQSRMRTGNASDEECSVQRMTGKKWDEIHP